MRMRRLVAGAVAVMAVLAGGAQLVRADIDTTLQSMVAVPAPPAVLLGAQETATDILVFEESQGAALTTPITVDAAVPGEYRSNAELAPVTLPIGTVVCSHLIHFDPLASDSKATKGKVTFDWDVVGVIVLDATLDASDAELGAAGTTYPASGSLKDRGLELGNPRDRVTLDPAMRMVAVSVEASTVLDQVRVLTACPPPPVYVYTVKVVCGQASSLLLDEAIVTPGIYATDVNIANPNQAPADLAKRVIVLAAEGQEPVREPATAGAAAGEEIVLPGLHATMDDCQKIAELLQPAVPPSLGALPLTVGFLEIRSPVVLDVTAVYTTAATFLPGAGGRSVMEVEHIEGRLIGG